MSEPIPVQPVTLNYSGPDAALGPPIRHPGMELPSPIRWADVWQIARQTSFGAFYSASLIIILGWLSEQWFPKHSSLRLMLPLPPVVGMLLVGTVAQRLSKRTSTCAWSFGLWVGGFALLGLFVVYLMGIGYMRDLAQLF